MQTTAADELEIGRAAPAPAPRWVPAPPAPRTERPYILPAVLAGSVAFHVGVLTVASLLPGPPVHIASTESELTFQLLDPPAPEPPPEPEVAPPEPIPAAAIPVPRVRPEARREPPPPAPVLTAAAEASSPSEWAHPEGEAGGSLQGTVGGTGDGVAEPTASEATPEPRRGVSRAELRRQLLGYIRGPLSQHIASHTSYPVAARREGMQGVVVLRLRLDEGGHVLGVRLSRSSGHAMLDEAALASVRSMSAVPAPPAALPWDETQELPLPVTYRLQ